MSARCQLCLKRTNSPTNVRGWVTRGHAHHANVILCPDCLEADRAVQTTAARARIRESRDGAEVVRS